MANSGITVTIRHALPDGNFNVTDGSVADPNSAAPSTTTVAADVATLVADGATPTQAHVTTLNTDWATFLTAYNSYKAGVAALTSHVTLLYDPSQVNTMNKVRAVLRHLELRLAGRIGEG